MPRGTFTRNNQRQSPPVVNAPPRSGPRAGATDAGTDTIAEARLRSSDGNALRTAASDTGTSTPPPRPCSTPGGNEHTDVRGQCARGRADDEHQERGGEGCTSAETAREPSGGGHRHRERNEVGSDNEAGACRVCSGHLVLNRGQRNHDRRGVHQVHGQGCGCRDGDHVLACEREHADQDERAWIDRQARQSALTSPKPGEPCLHPTPTVEVRTGLPGRSAHHQDRDAQLSRMDATS